RGARASTGCERLECGNARARGGDAGAGDFRSVRPVAANEDDDQRGTHGDADADADDDGDAELDLCANDHADAVDDGISAAPSASSTPAAATAAADALGVRARKDRVRRRVRTAARRRDGARVLRRGADVLPRWSSGTLLLQRR